MRSAWPVAAIRAAESELLAALPAGALMRRAAAGLARRCAAVLQRRGGVYGGRIVLLVGSGDNGADALYAAAALARRGAAVVAVAVTPGRVHAAAAAEFTAAGGQFATGLPAGADLVVDGIVGIGARGALRDRAAELAGALAALTGRDGTRATVVSVDVPSGVDVDTAAVPGQAVRADITVSFGLLKACLVAQPAAALAGQVELVDIGLSIPDSAPLLRVPDASDVAGWWPRRGPQSDKYSRGVVGVATGSSGYPGAAKLSVSGALAGPAGLVRYAGPAAQQVVGAFPPVVVAPAVEQSGRVQAWLFGCGAGLDERAQAQLQAVLASDVPVVLDADALTLLAGDPGWRDRLRHRHPPTIITPHDREFERLAGPPGPDRAGGAAALARSTGAIVVLKGERTIVAAPQAPPMVNPTGTAALASGGTGDVLAGLIASLLAGGVAAANAAAAAAFVHGLAARAAVDARGGGLAPITATDVAAAIPAVVANLTANHLDEPREASG